MPFLTNDMMRSIIMDHYSNPSHKHQPKKEGYTKIHMHSDNCIDDMDIFVLIENNVIKDACFDGVGCTIATSSSDIMCELLIGKTIEEALQISRNDVAEELDGLPPIKMHCSNLAADGLQAAIENYKENNQ